MGQFLYALKHYAAEILPALAAGFFLSGLVHEFVSDAWVKKNLGRGGLKGIFYATIVGTALPICCWGSLPVALSFHKKGSRLGPVLAFLVATPATSISALLVTYRLLGPKFTAFIFLGVILMGMLIGIIGNAFVFKPRRQAAEACPDCTEEEACCEHKKGPLQKLKGALKYAFVDMPREIGIELAIGIVLAAIVATAAPVGLWVRNNLAGALGYGFALVFGLLMYICSTATVPLVDAFINQGLSSGAGMVLLLAGPITSYGTILVLRKEFGAGLLLFYLAFVSFFSLALGYAFSLIA